MPPDQRDIYANRWSIDEVWRSLKNLEFTMISSIIPDHRLLCLFAFIFLSRAESNEWKNVVEGNFDLARNVYERRQDKYDTSAVSNRAASIPQTAKIGTPLGGFSIPTTPAAYSPIPAMSPAFGLSYNGSISPHVPPSPMPYANITAALPEEEVCLWDSKLWQ